MEADQLHAAQPSDPADLHKGNTTDSLVAGYEFIYLATLDLGHLLDRFEDRPDDHRALADARSKISIFLEFFSFTVDRHTQPPNFQLGPFTQPDWEGAWLGPAIREAVDAGGKQVFTESFLASHAPILFRFESGQSLGKDDGAVPNLSLIERGHAFELKSDRACTYTSTHLRLFESGAIGLEIRFKYSGAPLPVKDVIDDLGRLESNYARRAAYHKLQTVFEGVRTRASGWGWRKQWLTQDQFARLASQHRILIVEAITHDGATLSVAQLADAASGLRDVCGLLNRAPWYLDYWERYMTEVGKKFISYQMNELFITDGNSTLIYFPAYWTRGIAKTQYIQNILTALSYLLSWESVAHYFDKLINEMTTADSWATTPTSKQDTESHVRDVFRVRRILLALHDALSERSLVNHGFTARVIAQFMKERALRKRIALISRKVETAAAGILAMASHTEAVESHKETVQSTESGHLMQRLGLWIAVMALVVGVLLNSVSLWVAINSLRVNRELLRSSASRGASRGNGRASGNSESGHAVKKPTDGRAEGHIVSGPATVTSP
jgi:hypothetical protein